MYPSICCLPAYTRHDLKFRIITNGRIIMRVYVYICMYVCVCALKEIVCVASFIRSLACLIWEFVFIGSTFLVILPSFFCFLFFYFSSSEEAFFIIARMFTIITSVRSVFAICLWRFAVVVVVASHFIINWLSFILFHDSIIVDASIIVVVAQWAEWLFIRKK